MPYWRLIILTAAALVQAGCLLSYRIPPSIPVTDKEGALVADLAQLIEETRKVEIREVYLCRRYGARCYEPVWRVLFPEGWIQKQIVLLADYPGAVVKEMNAAPLQPGGAYSMYVGFQERTRWRKQTARETFATFCIKAGTSRLEVADTAECTARLRAEDRKANWPEEWRTIPPAD